MPEMTTIIFGIKCLCSCFDITDLDEHKCLENQVRFRCWLAYSDFQERMTEIDLRIGTGIPARIG